MTSEHHTGRSPGRWGGYAALAVAALVAAAALAWAFTTGDDGKADTPATLGVLDSHRPEVGDVAPDFALRDARDAGNVIRLSDFRGTPVVVNWYATWCGPCRREIPDFAAASQALEGQVVFLGVNLEESADQAVGLLDEFGATYPSVLDADGEVYTHYRGLGMPTTYFIDAEGVVVEFGSGLVTEDALVAALGRLGVDYQPAP